MLHRMTEQEIAIRKIKNLRMVSIYEFTSAVQKEGTAGTPSGKPSGCTAVTVLYGDGKQITLSELDPYFEELTERILEVYAETADRNSVLMDEVTRKLMEKGAEALRDPALKGIPKGKGRLTPVMHYDSCMARRFLPLTEYIIGQLESVLERNGTITDRVTGWRGRGMLRLQRGSEAGDHPVEILREGKSEYKIVIGNYPDSGENLRVQVFMRPEETEVAFAAERTELVGQFRFAYGFSEMETWLSVSLDGKEIGYENEKYPADPAEKPDEREQKLLPDGTVPTVIYRLPFGASCMMSEKKQKSGDIRRFDFLRSMVFADAGYAETLSWTMIKNEKSGVVLRKNNCRTIRTEIGEGRYQTYYDEAEGGASGRYRTSLSGRFFIS